MRILIADRFSPRAIERLEDGGHEVVSKPELGPDDLGAACAEINPEVLVVRSTKVDDRAITASSSLSVIVRAGAGVNTIDLESASRNGVFVANCPGKNAIAVAELTMGLLLSIDRRIPQAMAELKSGSWNKKKYSKAKGILGRRLGLVGFGAIAREVARRARAFGMQVRAFDPYIDARLASIEGVSVATDLDELLAGSDVVSVHVPYGTATHHLIGQRELALLPDGGIVLHLARGGVVDDVALAAEVASGRLTAGLDVYEDEPGAGKASFDHPLRELEGFHGTPHIGASTEQAADAIGDEVVRIIEDFASDGVVPNTCNVVDGRPARCSIVVRHLDQVGVLAGVLEALRREQLSVKEMQNIVFAGEGAAASATITVERMPSDALLASLRAKDEVLAVDVRATDI